jgi:hypothetical protein
MPAGPRSTAPNFTDTMLMSMLIPAAPPVIAEVRRMRE